MGLAVIDMKGAVLRREAQFLAERLKRECRRGVKVTVILVEEDEVTGEQLMAHASTMWRTQLRDVAVDWLDSLGALASVGLARVEAPH